VVIAVAKELRKYWSTFCEIVAEEHHGKSKPVVLTGYSI
jgi:hypothetical protein